MAAAEDVVVKKTEAVTNPPRGFRWFALRYQVGRWQAIMLGALCILICGAIWWFLTRGATVEERLLSPSILPSPAETFGDFQSLWFDRALTAQYIR